MSLDRDIERGRMAAEVLNNPVYAEAYDLLERELFDKWRISKDKDEREQLHRLSNSLRLLRSVLDSTMRNGEIATDKLVQKQKLLQRLGSRLRAA